MILPELEVSLVGLQGSLAAGHRAYPRRDGSFSVFDVSAGAYELRVSNRSGDVIAREQVIVTPLLSPVSVRLPAAKGDRPVTGTISYERLRHKTPKKAYQAYRRAADAYRKGKVDVAIERLRKAIEIDPDYFEARLNLGIILLKADRVSDSLAHLTRAIRLDPSSAVAHQNAGVAFYLSELYQEAEMAARVAIRKDPNRWQPHFVLGLSMIRQRHITRETATSLRRAAKQHREAHITAAEVFIAIGDREAAQGELQTYLGLEGIRHRDYGRSLLGTLSESASSRGGGVPVR